MVQTLAEWLERIEHLHPQGIALGLERVVAVARRLGLERSTATVITVGGTNGKGSCVAVLERLLLAGGARVGAYTSPHLVRYNERVRVLGREVEDDELCEALAAVDAARSGVALTFFEFGTLAALEIFRRRQCDWLLLEVGLGGRLDAVNIIDADLAVITSIALDHSDWLGTDRRLIALEKAGILRRGHAVVCGDRQPPSTLRASARVLGSTWYGIGESFDACRDGDAWHWTGSSRDGAPVSCEVMPPPALNGDNVACALQALALLGALPQPALLQELLPRIGLAGRQQHRRIGLAQCVLDVAHNPAGIASLVQHLQGEALARHTCIIFGAMRDKDVAAMLAALAPLADAWVFPRLAEARAATNIEVRAALGAAAHGRQVECTASVAAALAGMRPRLSAGDRLVVCGSFHVVGPAIEWLDMHEGPWEEWR